MDGVTFETFDPTPYQRVPVVNLHSMVVLAKALLDGKPDEAPAAVHKRADKLHEAVGVAENELTARLREQAAAVYGAPVVFDGGADALWTYCFRALEGLQAYMHTAFDPFIAKPDTAFGQSLAQGRERAKRAATLHQRMFGGRGLAFLRGSFRDQCEVTGSILRLIKEDDLVDQLSELLGPSLVHQLFGLQEHYEAMVVDQLKTPPPSVQSLGELRRRLMRLIGQYNNAVLDMLDEDVHESLEIVVKSLRPMITLRDQLVAGARRKGAAGDEDVQDEEPELDDDEEVASEEGGGSDVGNVGTGA